MSYKFNSNIMISGNLIAPNLSIQNDMETPSFLKVGVLDHECLNIEIKNKSGLGDLIRLYIQESNKNFIDRNNAVLTFIEQKLNSISFEFKN